MLLNSLTPALRQYLTITLNYWVFTITDGALRMLVVLHFHSLGFQPLQIAMLFLFYEFFGVITNLVGGWLGARIGLNRTMNIGLGLQIIALSMLLVPNDWLTILWVMSAQALSGIAKDLNKMSAKSAIKILVPNQASGQLYKWVAVLTGSKNTLKGVGFFVGGALLSLVGFHATISLLTTALIAIWLLSLFTLRTDLGQAKTKAKFSELFSKSNEVNVLSAARLFLFGARDVWFVVALPVYLATQYDWDHWTVGSYLALWIIGYGIVQSLTPMLTGRKSQRIPDGKSACLWACLLAIIPATIAIALNYELNSVWIVALGLILFGVLFAINSSIHSFLIVHYADAKGVSLDVGFYYMANAGGRLIGTVLSGWLFQDFGLVVCLWVSASFISLAALLSIKLPRAQ